MTALILVLAAAFIAWLGYLIGQQRAETRARAREERLRWRLNHPSPYPWHRIEP